MPFVSNEGARIYYRVEGREDLPLLVLVHALGTDHGLWDSIVPALLRRFRLLRVDLRGHGASDCPAGDYTIPLLAQDVLAAVDATGAGSFAYCGLSLGGMIGQWLGLHAAERLEGLVLANTSPRVADPSLFETRRKTVLAGGMNAIAPAVMERFFSARMLASGDAAAGSARATLLATVPVGYAGCCAAIRDMDHTAELSSLRTRVLVIAGDQDVSTPWAGHGDVLAQRIAGAESVRLPAAHLSCIECPSTFAKALFDFLVPNGHSDSKVDGLAVRRTILGDVYVNHAVANTPDWANDFQELITRYAWGTIWTRPGLDPRLRRLLVLAMTASMGRWEEFRLHVRAGLAGGLELADLNELLLQLAIYAGVPAANTGFHIVAEVSGTEAG